MEVHIESLLEKIGGNILADLSEVIPTTTTSDANILEACKSIEINDPLQAFHYLSLSHYTILYHRSMQKKTISHSGRTVDGQEPSLTFDLSYSQMLRPSNVNETKLLLEQLPTDWTVVQVTSESKGNEGRRGWKKIAAPLNTPFVYVSRCKCGSDPSVIIKKIYPPKDEDAVRSIIQEMELIKAENKVINKNYKNNLNEYLAKREELNNRLRILVRSMEIAWLKHWSILFIGALPPHHEKTARCIISEVAGQCGITLTDEQLVLLTLMICVPSPVKSFDDLVVHEFPVKAGVAAVLQETVRSEVFKAFMLRIGEHQEQLNQLRCSQRSPVILILDKSVITLPWEMIHVLHNHPVTRMPSFQSLVLLYLHHSRNEKSVFVRGVNVENGFYILDPEDNLPRSKERLKESFAATKWAGCIGERPSHDQFKEALSSKDIFAYVGHGSGSQYMPSQLVESLDCRPLVLLYGCSSTSLMKRGSIADPWGVVLNYLIAFCPCVVGMLWEVMDKDTDLLTREMIKAMRGISGPRGSPLEDPPSDIALIVSRARPLCSWYLISAALSVYGLPLGLSPRAL